MVLFGGYSRRDNDPAVKLRWYYLVVTAVETTTRQADSRLILFYPEFEQSLRPCTWFLMKQRPEQGITASGLVGNLMSGGCLGSFLLVLSFYEYLGNSTVSTAEASIKTILTINTQMYEPIDSYAIP